MPSRVPEDEDVVSRFWNRVLKTASCWLWVGPLDQNGYGHFWVREDKKTRRSHRFSYELLHGSVPSGMEIDHRSTCLKSCVNPDHLRPVTRKQNQENRAGVPRSNSSGVRGVYWNKRERKWHAKVKHNGRTYSAGYFPRGQLDRAEAAVVALRNRLFTHNDLDRNL